MQIDPLVLDAFTVLERAFYGDCLRPLPSRHNLEYRGWLERQFMVRIGVALPTLPDTRQRTWTGHLIQRYFWKELGLSSRPELPTDLPVFLWRLDYVLPSVDVVAIADCLTALGDPAPSLLCLAERRFTLLSELLHLSPAETALLQLAYAACHLGLPQSSESYATDEHALQAVLMNLHWSDLAERSRVFAMLLAVPVDEAATLLDAPVSVVALHLIDNGCWHRGGNAMAYATATDKLLELLETRYQTHAGLLADMQAMAVDLGAFDTDYPADLLYEELPLLVADTYMASRHGHSLDAAQLATLVWWHTGWLTDAQTLQPLAHTLPFETVVHVLIDATLSYRQNGGTITPLALLQALYSAA